MAAITDTITRGVINMFNEEQRTMIENEIKRIESRTDNQGKAKIRPQDLALVHLLRGMLRDGRLPWQKAFDCPSVNVISKTQYTGINRHLLDGGEYITYKQLLKFNKDHGTNFRISKPEAGDDIFTRVAKSAHIILHYNVKPMRDPTPKELEHIKNNELVFGVVINEKTGEIKIQPPASCSYFNVFSTVYIKDPDTGEAFPRLNIEKYNILLDGEQIINEYKKLSGVKIVYDTPGRCFYVRNFDTIHMSPLNTFKTRDGVNPVVEYYSTVFHEMAHSTGTANRCNRECFLSKTSSQMSSHYSMEECVAELTSALLLSELNIPSEDRDLSVLNSSAYVAGWLKWLLSSTGDRYGTCSEKLIYAIRRAEKARNYIMSWFEECKSSDRE